MLMYVAVRYEGDPLGDRTPDLELVSRATRDGEPRLGNLCVLLRWHQAFPVTQQERYRHATVVRFQGNRNPFIDSVNYACYIDFSNMTKINGPVIPCSASSIGITENNAVRPQIGLWPNPTAGQFSLFYTTTVNEPVVVRLIDVTGRVVFTQQYTSASGSNLFALDLSTIARGVYTLQVSGETTVSEKLIVQ
jgi:hypothetical protein